MERGKLTLFVAGAEAAGGPLVEALRRSVSERRVGAELEVVDVLADPQRARAAQVLMTPALVLEGPGGQARAFGDLSDLQRALASLGLEV